jgi:hypothetical protein
VDPFIGLAYEPRSHLLRIAGAIGVAHDVDQRVAAFEPRLERTKLSLDVTGEIKAAGTSGHLVSGVRLGGNQCHRLRGRERSRAWACGKSR